MKAATALNGELETFHSLSGENEVNIPPAGADDRCAATCGHILAFALSVLLGKPRALLTLRSDKLLQAAIGKREIDYPAGIGD